MRLNSCSYTQTHALNEATRRTFLTSFQPVCSPSNVTPAQPTVALLFILIEILEMKS